MPDNTGVGDVIEYDSDGNDSIDAIVFIHGRTSATEYTVKKADGSNPTEEVTSDYDWKIYRAYTSLANWQGLTENSNIDSSVVDFDTSRDITGSYLHVACYADGNDFELQWILPGRKLAERNSLRHRHTGAHHFTKGDSGQ